MLHTQSVCLGWSRVGWGGVSGGGGITLVQFSDADDSRLSYFSTRELDKNTMTVGEQEAPHAHRRYKDVSDTPTPPPRPLMSLTFGDSTSHSSNWDGGQVPPRTLRLINHPRFNICPVPKGCQPTPPPHTTTTPSLVKMGPWLYSSFQHPSILPGEHPHPD